MNSLNPQSISEIPMPKDDPHQRRPCLAVDASHQRVGAPDAFADHHIILGNKCREARDFLRIELSVAIGKHHIGLRRGANAGNHRAAIAAILLMMDDFDMRIFTREAIGDRAGLVGASVVDDDDFIIIGNARKLGEKTSHHALDVRFLVVRGQKDADAWQA